jgi:hypothetical protein
MLQDIIYVSRITSNAYQTNQSPGYTYRSTFRPICFFSKPLPPPSCESQANHPWPFYGTTIIVGLGSTGARDRVAML